ncbi:cytochrome c oxidase assembly protein subunit 15 [Vreelandella subglaciescola]|jgi:cytochrome c oxidase assembly protein subunit 15|uniref:Cytochrome c oxidase assembly protein subunit 15 n=2 Tax=Vreelandella subglaciescola TaxID=29571 RepID=A0A1M7FG23_9GAMM|nr:cytochrome c oxidase assembly protein subunit 15 [Halomonas subglaciescola]
MVNWATFAVVLAVVVIMLGAWTRLVDAGLGCPDWPGCYGFMTVPQSETHIAIANTRFPETPVDVVKGWTEMIHRYAAGTLGLVVFGLAACALRHRRSGVPFKLPLFIAGFILLQGAFGMWTVTLKLWPQVVALHLLGGFTTLSLLAVLVFRLRAFPAAQSTSARVTPEAPSGPAASASSLARLRPWLYGGLLLIILQIALGAWTAANYAAVACTDLPTCQGQWWPEGMDFRHGFDITQHVGPNYLGGQLTAGGRVAIQVTHRAGALLVLAYFGILLAWIWRRNNSRELHGPVRLVATALATQIALGLGNVLFHIPLPVAVAHNAMGAGLLLSVIYLIWRHHLLPQAQLSTATHTTIMHQEVTA